MRLAILVPLMTMASCSAPSVSDTDETKAPGQPISADPGADVGVAATAAQSLVQAFRRSIGLVEVRDAKGDTKTTCSAFALGTDLALTSSLCATDCARTRVRFLSSAQEDVSSSKAPARVSWCSAVEVKDTKEGQGFALLRLALVDETDAFPAARGALAESTATRAPRSVVLVSAQSAKAEIAVSVSRACTLRYAASASAFSTHDCAPDDDISATTSSSATLVPGGILVDVASRDVLGLFDRTLSGAHLVTPSGVILAK